MPVTSSVTSRAPSQSFRNALAALVVLLAGVFLGGCETTSLFGDDAQPTVKAPKPTTVVAKPTTPSGPVIVPTDGQVRIAILLPFSHPDRNTRAVSQALQDAAQLAMFDMGAKSMVLLPQDTGTTAESAAAAANAAIDKGAELILGPLLANDVRAVAPVARARGVPVIAFSTDRMVAGDGVFLLSFLPEQEVNRVVNYATSQGRRRFVALVPASPYGQRVEEAFRMAVAQAGGEVVAVQSYESNAQALEPAVKAVAKLGFDSIFLPEGGLMLRSIGPILSVHGVDSRKVQFLGSGMWDDPATAREISLAGGWYALPPQEQRANFQTRYRQLYGSRAPKIGSLAYDAIALAATLANGRAGQRYTRTTIADPNGFAGIDGIFRFRADGMTERGLAVFQIAEGGPPTIISPAASTFQSPGF
jgi:ABC-type branched-subunit amino acid transport system substrate-binding protein